jgi:uncharacterized protein
MHVLLTGASSGIGAALARVLSQEGHVLTLVARRQALLDEVAATCVGPTHVLPADLTDPVVVEGLVAAAEALAGPVDILVNNAGIEYVGATATMDPDVGIDVASAAAYVFPPYGTHYTASKAALAAADHQLRWELRKTPIRVMTVYPGPVRTEMGTRVLGHYRTDPSKGLPWGNADELAQRILQAMKRGDEEIFYPRFYALSRSFARLTRFILRFIPVELRAEG